MSDDITPQSTTTGATPASTPASASTPAPAASAATPAPAPAAPAATPATRPHPAQFGTIVWGMVLLGLCGFVALTQFGPGLDADRFLWGFVGVIIAGVALVAVGIAAAFRR